MRPLRGLRIPGRSRGSSGFYYGWVIVGTTALADFMVVGIATAFAVLFKPMSLDLGWTRAQVNGALTLRSVVAGACALWVGPLVDRFGARLLITAGGALVGLALFSLAFTQEPWQFWALYGLLGGLGASLMGQMVTSASVAKWFVRRRGRAMAVGSFAISVCGVVIIPLARLLEANLGWRTTWQVMAAMVWLLVMAPAFVLIRRQPEDMGLQPDGLDPTTQAPDEQGDEVGEVSWRLGEALRTRALWLVLAANNLSMLGLASIFLHEIPYLTDIGYSKNVAALALTVHFLWATIAAFPTGLMLERIPARYLSVAAMSGMAVAMLLLMNASSLAVVFLFTFVYGYSAGVQLTVTRIILANYYGRAFLGTIQGVTMPINLAVGAGGPLFAAAIYDTTGSYRAAFTVFMAAWLLGAFVMSLAVPPRRQAVAQPAPTPRPSDY